MATLATQVRDSARARRAPRARGEAARFGRDAGVAVASDRPAGVAPVEGLAFDTGEPRPEKAPVAGYRLASPAADGLNRMWVSITLLLVLMKRHVRLLSVASIRIAPKPPVNRFRRACSFPQYRHRMVDRSVLLV